MTARSFITMIQKYEVLARIQPYRRKKPVPSVDKLTIPANTNRILLMLCCQNVSRMTFPYKQKRGLPFEQSPCIRAEPKAG